VIEKVELEQVGGADVVVARVSESHAVAAGSMWAV
jgi:hypothetical protein